jgi:superfamily I DNA and RNA helicase
MSEPCQRRSSDKETGELDASFAQCPANNKDVATIHQDLQEIKETVAEMRDIIVAWQDAKAFFKVIKIIGEMLKWLVATGAAVGVIWYFVSGRNK